MHADYYKGVVYGDPELIASVNLTLDNELSRSRYAVRLGSSADQSTSPLINEYIKTIYHLKVKQKLCHNVSNSGIKRVFKLKCPVLIDRATIQAWRQISS